MIFSSYCLTNSFTVLLGVGTGRLLGVVLSKLLLRANPLVGHLGVGTGWRTCSLVRTS